MVAWDSVTPSEVLRAMQEYDRLGAEAFFAPPLCQAVVRHPPLSNH
jgi:hypothetical protein